jgi:hypothetical protein
MLFPLAPVKRKAYGEGMILTDASGRPFEKPEPPSADATIDEKIAYLRAHAAYNDAVSSAANRAFDKAFRKAVRK